MAGILLKGTPVNTSGNLPAEGAKAPDFSLTNTDLEPVSLSSYAGKRLVLNIFPSLDTGVCAASVKRFNTEAEKLADTMVLCISKDLPFAQKRFCGTEGLNSLVMLSGFRDANFGKDYGVEMTDGPLQELYSRAVVVLDESGVVLHAQQVPEIAQEPDYDAVLAVLR